MSNVVSLSTATAANKAQAAPVTGAYQTTGWSGATDTTVSSQWFKRPADQKFLDLNTMHAMAKAEAEASHSITVDSAKIKVVADSTDPNRIMLAYADENGVEHEVKPTHYSFGQACRLVDAPAAYLTRLPAKLAAINLQYGLASHRAELVKVYTNEATAELKAITGPAYGRIYDHELIEAVQAFAGNGVGDTHWKVPGMLTGQGYNPFVDPSKDTTTLYASDRDVFLFLVDDTHPIEIGTLPNGDPDLVFRGFYGWNSEVGDKSLGFATMLMRGVCANRILWGVQDFERILVRHSKFAPSRFSSEIAPALEEYANGSTEYVTKGIAAARDAVVARDKDDRLGFLKGRGFGKKAATAIIDAVLNEEGREPESVWDFVQGITAHARTIEHTDARVEVEKVAGKLMSEVAKAA